VVASLDASRVCNLSPPGMLFSSIGVAALLEMQVGGRRDRGSGKAPPKILTRRSSTP
jgi:hypothetical protein